MLDTVKKTTTVLSLALSCALPAGLGLLSSNVSALQESRLYLPKKHADLKLKLFKAAKLAEELPNCREVVSGTLHLGQSTERVPIFKIVCRNAERRTFPVLMDGVDYVYLNPPEIIEEDSEPESVAEVDPALAKLENEAEYWKICEAGVKARSKNMLSVEWLYVDPVTPHYTEAGEEGLARAVYELPFNAQDIQGHSLRFKGECSFESVDEYEIQLRPR